MPLQATSGAASYDAFGGGAAAVPQYIEDVFSTWLYTGNGSTQTITNGIDLSTKGGLVWAKRRNSANSHFLFDTARGVNNFIQSDTTAAAQTSSGINLSFNSNGWSQNNNFNELNLSGSTYASWTFREQPKFFDVVTYTGTGSARTVSHNLGSAVGFLIVKRTDAAGESWRCWHRSGGANNVLTLNSTDAKYTDSSGVFWNLTAPTSTQFSVGTETSVNASGGTYVAYLFAHDAGGFGLTGTDNVISCGSYTGNGSAQTISLGYEPQWLMIKSSSLVDTNWTIFDSMRGIVTATGVSADAALVPNTANAEVATDALSVTATGFTAETNTTHYNRSGQTYIYIAIRRGPMKVPTSGTSVFSPVARAGTNANATITAGFTPDLAIIKNRTNAIPPFWTARLTGNQYMTSNTTNQEQAADTTALQTSAWQSMTGLNVGTTSGFTNASATQYINYFFKRATGFFDVLTFIGSGANRTITHNLGVVPELIIVKNRNAGINNWAAYYGDNTDRMLVNSNAATVDDITYWNDTTPTASVFTVGTNSDVNTNNYTYIAYLFATLAGISKVGTYTGTGTSDGQSQTINCGFTAGARFIMIKPLVFGAGWQVFDTARGLGGNEPTIQLNSSSEEFATDDAVSTNSSGFNVIRRTATGNTDTNQSGTTYFYLAIA